MPRPHYNQFILMVSQVINPALNTVPYVHALLANISAFQSQSGVSTDGEYLWQKMRIFLENFDERQIRYVGTELNEVIAAVADFARQSRQVCPAAFAKSHYLLIHLSAFCCNCSNSLCNSPSRSFWRNPHIEPYTASAALSRITKLRRCESSNRQARALLSRNYSPA